MLSYVYVCVCTVSRTPGLELSLLSLLQLAIQLQVCCKCKQHTKQQVFAMQNGQIKNIRTLSIDGLLLLLFFLLLSMSSPSRLLQPARTHCWHRCSYHCSTGDKFLSNVAQSNRRRKEMTVSVTCSRHRYRHRPQPSGLVPLWLLSHDTLKNQGEGKGPFLVVAFRVRRLFFRSLAC